jgi:hypothetical protein
MVAWSRAYRTMTPPTNLGDSPNTIDSHPAPERDVSPRNASIAMKCTDRPKRLYEIFQRCVQVPKGGVMVPPPPVPWPHIHARRCCIAKIRPSYCPRRQCRSPLSHKLLAKNEAGSPKLGASTLARKLDSVEGGSVRFIKAMRIIFAIIHLPTYLRSSVEKNDRT